jgi:hypothetical protein
VFELSGGLKRATRRSGVIVPSAPSVPGQLVNVQ